MVKQASEQTIKALTQSSEAQAKEFARHSLVLQPILAPLKVFPNAVRESDPLTVCSEIPIKELGFVPTVDQVKAMTLVELRDTFYTNVHYKVGMLVTRLTFETSGKYMSPPEGTYEKEPDDSLKMPKNTHIKRIQFGTHKLTPSNWSLCSLEIFDRSDKLIAEVKGTKEATY